MNYVKSAMLSELNTQTAQRFALISFSFLLSLFRSPTLAFVTVSTVVVVAATIDVSLYRNAFVVCLLFFFLFHLSVSLFGLYIFSPRDCDVT